MSGTIEERKPECSIEQFLALDIRIGTVLGAQPSPGAHVPAYRLEIDFGPLGVLTSSARITGLYAPEDLIGVQVTAVVNFLPRQVASVRSQCLVLGAVGDPRGVVLLRPERPVAPGTPVA
jgi:tRNA-binding protein